MIAWIGLSGSPVEGSEAEIHPFGTVGAAFASDAWERKQFSGDLGRDQFQLVGGDCFLVAFEFFELYGRRADFVGEVEEFIAGIEGRLGSAHSDPEVAFERYGEFSRATGQIRGEYAGIPLIYQVDVLSSGDGVGYLWMSWTQVANQARLEGAIDELVESLRLPGPGSEWYEKSRVRPNSFEFGEWTLEVSIADSILTPSDSEPGERYSFAGDDGNLALHLFVDELAGGADEVLTEVRRVAASDGPYEELLRSDLELPAGRGRLLLLRKSSDPPVDMALAVVGLGDDHWIDIRMVTSGRAGHREELWRALLGSVRARREAPPDAFPLGDDEPAARVAAHLTVPARALLESGRLLGEASWSAGLELLGDDLLILDGGGLRRVETSDTPAGKDASAVLLEKEEHRSGTVVAWGIEVLFVAAGGEVYRVVDGQLVPAGFRADGISAAGAELALARTPAPRTLPGMGELSAVGATTVLRRNRAGQERVLLELTGRRVVAIAARESRTLLAATPNDPFASPGSRTVELLLIDDGGRQTRLPPWREVRRVVATDDAWLVTGTTEAGVRGIFLTSDDGSRQLLVSGDPLGLSLEDHRLVFVAEQCLVTPVDNSRCVYSAPLSAVREHGPGAWPLTPDLLNDIAAELFGVGSDADDHPRLPASRPEIATLAAAAVERARERAGVALPLSPAGIDHLLGELAYDESLTQEAIALLSLITTEALLREGAIWLPPVTARPALPPRSGWEIENAFAVGLHPEGIVVGTLFDSEGWYRPFDEITARALGRRLYVGSDRESLREAVRAEEMAGLTERLERDSAAELLELLETRRENAHLREKVYRYLAALGRTEVLAAVAGHFAASEGARASDRLAAAAARLAGEPPAEAIDGLIDELRSAIAEAPSHAGLLLLLGSAYERSSLPDRSKYAKATYQRVLAVAPWGDDAESARAALERLATQ